VLPLYLRPTRLTLYQTAQTVSTVTFCWHRVAAKDSGKLISIKWCYCWHVVEKTPSSRELDELTDQLRKVDSADRRLDKSNVRVWFQNRRREQRQLALSSSSSSAAAAATTTTTTRADILVASNSCHWSLSSLGHLQWPTSRDSVAQAVTRLARYCIAPTDITNTMYNYSRPRFDC